MSGSATTYTSEGDLPTDGTFDLGTAFDAPTTRTRIVVRRPTTADDFNGTVVVEWLNVSGGVDAAPRLHLPRRRDPARRLRLGRRVGAAHRHRGRAGRRVDAARRGAPGPARACKALDPERYGELDHPGDAFSYDIYTQVGRALPTPGDASARRPRARAAAGRRASRSRRSRSRPTPTACSRSTETFDGFLIHSRGGAPAPLGDLDSGIDIAGTLGGTPTIVRDDLDVPVIIAADRDRRASASSTTCPARQPDSDRVRLWEVAGTAHADRYLLGPDRPTSSAAPRRSTTGRSTSSSRRRCAHLDAWVARRRRAAERPSGSRSTSRRRATSATSVGIVARRHPHPARRRPGRRARPATPPDGAAVICLLFGSTTADPGRPLAERYADRAAYLAAYEAAADAAIDAGFVLPEDREALLDMADPSTLGG